MKTENREDQPKREEKEIIKEETTTDKDLYELCNQIWDSFITDKLSTVDKLCTDLAKKEKEYFDTYLNQMRRKEVEPLRSNGLIDEELDEEDLEQLKRYDPTKSKSLVQDLRKEKENAEKQIYDLYKKKPAKFDPDHLYDEEYDELAKKKRSGAGEDNDDVKDEKNEPKKPTKRDKKLDEKQMRLDRMRTGNMNKVLTSCRLCLANNFITEEQILSFGKSTLLILPEYNRYTSGHFQIIPIDHRHSLLDLDEDQYEEVRNFMKCLVAMYDKMDYGVTFIEVVPEPTGSSHCMLECVATPRQIDAILPSYFKKSLDELESEWATHKKIIEIKKDKGGLRKQIPKNFPYLYVDFNTAFGYAHIIEKKEKFNRLFAHEIIGSELEIEKSDILYPKKRTKDELEQLKNSFLDKWKDYDWTAVYK